MKLKQEAFHLMRKVFQQHTSRWQQVLPELTKPQYAVLRSIAEQPGIEQIQLMDAAISSKATLAEMLVRMEEKGLLRREFVPSDKRRRFIYLTQEGETLLNDSLSQAHGVDNEFLMRLKPQDRQELIRILLEVTDEAVEVTDKEVVD